MPSMLIVDDDLHLRKLVLTYAQMENYQCREAESGDQALSRQNHPGRPRYDLRRGLPGRIYLLEELYEKIWGLEAMGDNATVAVHINRLREKIEPAPPNPGTSRQSGARVIGSGDNAIAGIHQ